jgi:UDP-N-acetylmuramoyl-tripeptide--D-alanyl-D-alanine ligase
MRGGHAATADEAARAVIAALRPGDVVMVKGSHASGMAKVVAALAARAAAARAVPAPC